MAYLSIPDIILEHNIQNVGYNLLQIIDGDDREVPQSSPEVYWPQKPVETPQIYPFPNAYYGTYYPNVQNTVRPILGRRSSLPEPPTYPRKMSADSVLSDGLLFSKTTLLPERSSYFEEVRPRNCKGFAKKFQRRGSLNSTYLNLNSEKEMSLTAHNIFPKVCPPPLPKDLLQVLKILEDNLMHFVTLSRSLNNHQPTLFPIVEKDAGLINGLGKYYGYLVTLAIREKNWVSLMAPALNLRDKFLDSFTYLCQELHGAIAKAQVFTENSGEFEESQENREAAEELNYWIREIFTFTWLMLRINSYPCQVQERNLFIGF
ncbi:uncharacterized protein LOC129786129 [Lutzomyia longipalpis]|uniref:uncharacterized protein LOC129786129 n=1 Tax=Lutzomyia longipalpis TaxID=7200 RepID=UPI002483C5EA|nr:uncharacterized protein LOC129786129 [Lutzomyia longipalpis]